MRDNEYVMKRRLHIEDPVLLNEEGKDRQAVEA